MELDRGSWYLGRLLDESGEPGKPLTYESADLTTHGVIVGMTGSGKTGLGIDLLEEAVLSGVPCLVLDPKGDMGNLDLVFPDLAPADFEPWVDAAEADRRGVTVPDLAASTATFWKEGLEEWDIGADRLRRLRDAAEVTIYTPGSDAGVPLDVLGSLDAPDVSWDDHVEDLRDQIEGFVSSLLVLAGIEADPVSSPPHILLATIIEEEWRAGRDLDLARLVGLVQQPPVRKLGVFPLDEFYPPADRTELAHTLNGLLASPSFGTWLAGVPLDIERLLTAEAGTAVPIIYLAHLSETERQFVVTLLLARLVTWMRARTGASGLRLLVYMDEVVGFAPPVAEPPAKKQILTILKQGRAYGVGMVLATQNPVDLDYKAMSNAGTWMVGRLQTENDKARVLEAITDAAGATDVAAVDASISNLDPRQFVLRTAGTPSPTTFVTRWAMSYLAGPLDRSQVAALTDDASRPDPPPATEAAAPPPAAELTATAPPAVAEGVRVGCLDPAAAWASTVGAVPGGPRWRPVAMVTATLRYDDRYAEVDHREVFEAILDPLTEEFDPVALVVVDHDAADVADGSPAEGSIQPPGAPIDDAGYWRDLAEAVGDHLAAERSVQVWKNPELKLYSRVGESEDDFAARCLRAAEEAADEALAKLRDRYESRIDRVRDQISRSDRRVAELGADLSAHQGEELVSGAGDLLGALVGGRSASGALRRAASRRSRSRRTEADLESARSELDEDRRDLVALEEELAAEVEDVVGEWHARAAHRETIDVPLERSDVEVSEIALVWVPTA